MDHTCDPFKIVPTFSLDGSRELIGTCWVCGKDFVMLIDTVKEDVKNLVNV